MIFRSSTIKGNLLGMKSESLKRSLQSVKKRISWQKSRQYDKQFVIILYHR